jgi:hypothetical protein
MGIYTVGFTTQYWEIYMWLLRNGKALIIKGFEVV